MQIDITFLDLLQMVYNDTQPSEVNVYKNTYRWIPVKKDYYNTATGYSLGTEIQTVIPFEITNLVSKKIISYDKEVLSPEEKDYLSEMLYPYANIIDHIQKIAVEPQKDQSDYRLVVVFNDGNPNMIMPSFPYNAPQYHNMRAGQHYTAEELKLW